MAWKKAKRELCSKGWTAELLRTLERLWRFLVVLCLSIRNTESELEKLCLKKMNRSHGRPVPLPAVAPPSSDDDSEMGAAQGSQRSESSSLKSAQQHNRRLHKRLKPAKTALVLLEQAQKETAQGWPPGPVQLPEVTAKKEEATDQKSGSGSAAIAPLKRRHSADIAGSSSATAAELDALAEEQEVVDGDVEMQQLVAARPSNPTPLERGQAMLQRCWDHLFDKRPNVVHLHLHQAGICSLDDTMEEQRERLQAQPPAWQARHLFNVATLLHLDHLHVVPPMIQELSQLLVARGVPSSAAGVLRRLRVVQGRDTVLRQCKKETARLQAELLGTPGRHWTTVYDNFNSVQTTHTPANTLTPSKTEWVLPSQRKETKPFMLKGFVACNVETTSDYQWLQTAGVLAGHVVHHTFPLFSFVHHPIAPL